MVNLGEIEKELNTDPKARQAFLADPVAFFRVRGVILSSEQQTALRQTTSHIAAGRVVSTVNLGQEREWRLVPAVQ